MIRRPPRSTQSRSSAASDVYKRQPWVCFRWLLGRLGCSGWWPGAVRAGAVGVAVQGDDVGVMDEAVDGRRGHDVVAEGLAPAGERQVRGHDHGSGLVAGCDGLEEQRGLSLIN